MSHNKKETYFYNKYHPLKLADFVNSEALYIRFVVPSLFIFSPTLTTQAQAYGFAIKKHFDWSRTNINFFQRQPSYVSLKTS